MPPVCKEHPFGLSCATDGKEVPASDPSGGYASGGGFSVYAKQPSYQTNLVQAYLNDSKIPLPPSKDFDPNHRGFPDVAANGQNILIFQDGEWQIVGGTSAASPTFGGIIALLNDHLMKAGQNPLGFANPFLYTMVTSEPSTFHPIGDLDTNNKDGCRYGYVSNPNPEPRWDPVNGLGTADFTAMLSYLDTTFIPSIPKPKRKLF